MGAASLHWRRDAGDGIKRTIALMSAGAESTVPAPGASAEGRLCRPGGLPGACAVPAFSLNSLTLWPVNKGMFVSWDCCVLPSRTIKRKMLTMGNCASSSLCVPQGGVGGKNREESGKRRRRGRERGHNRRSPLPPPWEPTPRDRGAAGLPGRCPRQDGDRAGAGTTRSPSPVSTCPFFLAAP